MMVGAALVTTAACETPSATGTAGGAAAGGIIGGAVGGTRGALVGVVAGGILGYGAGRHMEEQDRQRAAMALQQGQPTAWTNPSTGDSYQIQPGPMMVQNNQQCREFTMNADVGGQPQQVNGTACLQPDGTWRAINA